MKDIPVFTTPCGAACLVLREIPYKQEAYVRVLSTDNIEVLLKECYEFCVMAGAEHVYATADSMPDAYPLHNRVLIMRCDREALGESSAALWPVQEETAEQFQKMYNKKILSVDNSAYMDDVQRREMVSRGDGYFVHEDGELLGFGRVYDGQLLWIASLKPAAGEKVLKALCGVLTTETVSLYVSSTNHKAIGLYQRLGFVAVGESSSWYKIN